MESLSRVWLFKTPWTTAHQAPPSMGFSRQEYWSGLPLPSPILLLCLGSYPGNLALDCTISYCCGQWTGIENKRVTGVSKRRRKRGSIILQCFPVSGWFHRQLPYWVHSIQQVRNGSLNSKGSISVPAHIFYPVQLPRRDWDTTPSSNRHVEMDGSHISQLQLAPGLGKSLSLEPIGSRFWR